MGMPRRFGSWVAAVLALALSCGPFQGTARAATAPAPTGTCIDGNFFDGLDTRYAATYCRNALNAAGYGAAALSNTGASVALQREPTDAIVYHAGHALVAGVGNNSTALASVMAGTSGSSTKLEGLLGDPTALDNTGPGAVCDGSGHCRQVTVLNYPYESQLQKVNLAVFQSCNSARDGVLGYTSLATVAYNTGLVGTAIGFKNEVSWVTNAPGDNLAGDAFARRFWGDLQSGSTYSSALVDGANAGGGSTYGYSSYVYLHDPKAPSALRPAKYFVP
jgi:hypothetical protein